MDINMILFPQPFLCEVALGQISYTQHHQDITKWYVLYVSIPVWFWPVRSIETESKQWFLRLRAEKNGKLFRNAVSVLQAFVLQMEIETALLTCRVMMKEWRKDGHPETKQLRAGRLCSFCWSGRNRATSQNSRGLSRTPREREAGSQTLKGLYAGEGEQSPVIREEETAVTSFFIHCSTL